MHRRRIAVNMKYVHQTPKFQARKYRSLTKQYYPLKNYYFFICRLLYYFVVTIILLPHCYKQSETKHFLLQLLQKFLVTRTFPKKLFHKKFIREKTEYRERFVMDKPCESNRKYLTINTPSKMKIFSKVTDSAVI